MADFQILQPETTYTGSPIQPLVKGLPKSTTSLCPECSILIPARIFEDAGKVVMEKQCPDHGHFRDIVFSDVKLYLQMEEWSFGDNRGFSNPAVANASTCPTDCGVCNMHTSHTGLANLDLTNRCNLTCPVCFANANASGYIYEPDFETVRKMLQTLRNQRPVPNRIVQFSGGEPTIYPRFLDVLRMAKQMGFSHTQVATNGIKFADLEFAQQCKEAGLHTLYLQFDGVCDEIYRKTRGEALWETKMECIENVRKAGLKIVYVPTIVKGVNDHQIGDILRLALEYIECSSGISFQPVAFTGRIARHELEAKRFTLSDFAHAVKRQTGICDPYEDWFPLSCVTPFSKLIGALRGEETTTLSCHPHCSIGTYLFVDQDRKATPVTQFVDVGPMLREMDDLARKAGARRIQFFTKIEAWNNLRKFFHAEKAPEGPDLQQVPANPAGHDRQAVRARRQREAGLHVPHPDAGRHALHGPLQLRRGAGEALRNSLRRARRHGVSVLRLQLRPHLPRARREAVLDPHPDPGRDEAHSRRVQARARIAVPRSGAGGIAPKKVSDAI